MKMSIKTTRKTRSRSSGKRKKVPMPVKMALGIIGTIFVLIAIVGSVHGQFNATSTIAGGNVTGKVAGVNGSPCTITDSAGHLYISAVCITDHTTRAEMCQDLKSGAAGTLVNASEDAFKVLCNGIPQQ
jgi:hypothetical protein